MVLKTRPFVPVKLRETESEIGFADFGQAVAKWFDAFSSHVFVAATGLVVRILAPLLQNKTKDPAVVVLDQKGRFVISLVGGHIAGANALAERIAQITGGRAVITTATDVEGLPALDVLAKDLGLIPESWHELKNLAACLLAGEKIQLRDPESRLWPTLEKLGHDDLFMQVEQDDDWQGSCPGIWISWRSETSLPGRLVLHPSCLVAGLGFHRGTEALGLVSFIQQVFFENKLALVSLKTLATITSRVKDPGLVEAADALGVNVVAFSEEQLAGVTTPNPSSTTARLIGTHSVCEAAAMLAGNNKSLLVPKTKTRDLTLAVALAA
jgi:cobalt-precorrin 5A hydrolase